jgi:CheY-like chemotaxis protein
MFDGILGGRRLSIKGGWEMLDGKLECSAKLLIVDDEPAIRSSISQVLGGLGYHVRSAEDGSTALVEIENEIPDIILSDLNMPGMSGFELLSMVRARYPSIRVIAMSGTFFGDEVSSGVAADAFYQKGCGAGSLLKIIGSLPQSAGDSHFSHPAPIWIQPREHNTSTPPADTA